MRIYFAFFLQNKGASTNDYTRASVNRFIIQYNLKDPGLFVGLLIGG